MEQWCLSHQMFRVRKLCWNFPFVGCFLFVCVCVCLCVCVCKTLLIHLKWMYSHFNSKFRCRGSFTLSKRRRMCNSNFLELITTLCQQWHSFNCWRTSVLFVGPLIPLFWTSGDICPGFQSQCEWLACFITCIQWISQIHLWRKTCWPLRSQHCSTGGTQTQDVAQWRLGVHFAQYEQALIHHSYRLFHLKAPFFYHCLCFRLWRATACA